MSRATVMLVALIVAALVTPTVTPAAALAATPKPVTGPEATTMPTDPTGFAFTAFRSYSLPIVPGEPIWLQVVRDVAAGPIHFAELVADAPVDLGSTTWGMGGSVNGVPSYIADLQIPGPTAGTHTYQAIMDATGYSEAITLELVVDVAPVAETISILADANPVQAHHGVTLYAQLDGPGTGTAPGGDLVWRDTDTGQVLRTSTFDDPVLTLAADTLVVGTRHFTAAYAGDAEHAAATSPVFTLSIVADVVEATFKPLSITTVYPYKDGYRDTVKAGGTRSEPAAVSYTVKNSSGKTVRSATSVTGTGGFAWAWNGRTSSGAQVPAGTYAIYTRLVDGAGTVKTVRQSIKVSSKRLHWSSTSSTKTGGQTLKRTTTWGAWAFTMPSATAYRKLKVVMTGYADIGFYPASMGAQDARQCPWTTVSPNCVLRGYRLGAFAGNTATAYLNANEHKGRYVRAYAWLGSAAWMKISKVRLSLEYAILR